jgi:hypothetical protein
MTKITRLDDVRRAKRARDSLAQIADCADRRARARRYRLRAEELRAISEEVMLKETCLTLLSLAESYEQMAHTMDTMANIAGREPGSPPRCRH